MANLVTLARVQLAPVLAGVSPDLLEVLISAASDAVENYLRRKVIQDTVTETHDGDGGTELLLGQPNVVALSDVMLYDEDAAAWDTVSAADFRFDEDEGLLLWVRHPTNTDGYDSFPNGTKNVKIHYTAGLAADVAAVPAVIAQAVVETVVRMYESSKTEGGVTGESLGDYSYARGVAVGMMDTLPKSTVAGLSFYKNRTPA